MTVFSRIARRLKGSPVFIASLQAGGLMSVGDGISQTMVEKKDKFDVGRNIRFGLLGLCIIGPTLRTWYGILDRRINIQASKLRTAVVKMAVDQGIFAPIFIGNFLGINSLTQGNSLSQMKNDVSKNFKDVVISNYKLWPAVQLISFSVVPLQYRVLFVQSVAVFWNTYLSWKTNSESEGPIDSKALAA
ncbi:unnamed protein product [Orchesella dallaii]|uniref:Mitochondrial inner membrane protein Mpv17 n=1 Tax=Orchesella dallaii TaxID=48710 RepID=A0ABP1PTF2_9HEXA